MQAPSALRDLSVSALVAGFVAVLVSYASSAAIVFQAAEAAGASPAQIGGWLSTLGLGMGVTSLGLSLVYRTPILTAWSTPGAALLVTSLGDYTLAEAIGVFMFSGALVLACGITGLFARLMARIPHAIAAAMLAGVLLRFGLEAFAALDDAFVLVGAMCAAYLLGRRLWPRFAVLGVLATGLAIAGVQGEIDTARASVTLAMPAPIMPEFTLASLIGVGVPLFVVSMASQNAPGVATLRAAGYAPPISPLIAVTGLATLVLAPLGGFSICLAAITAAICMGPEAHPAPERRYMAAACAGGFYLLAGVFGGSIGTLFDALPQALIVAIAGLALLTTIGGSLHNALHDARQRDAALVTFLITASGVSLLGVGAAFWGLVGGLLTQGMLGATRRA
ncbi:benzoate/H(+) symporter BenE family transporter [Chromohalobacter israelensis]|uniref:benzoate/H(+) symporter BenE family transporter n=1 Tax=Chromohalobacter israelensis TaxID=141390 RepID=UPI003D7B49D3